MTQCTLKEMSCWELTIIIIIGSYMLDMFADHPDRYLQESIKHHAGIIGTILLGNIEI